MKTFFEKIPLIKGREVLVNYTSVIADATLERKWRYTVSYFGQDDGKSFGQEGFACLAQARVAAWSNLDKYIRPLTPVAAHETDDEVTEEILGADELYFNESPPPSPLFPKNKDVTGGDKPVR